MAKAFTRQQRFARRLDDIHAECGDAIFEDDEEDDEEEDDYDREDEREEDEDE